MSILNFFRPVPKQSLNELPDPQGPLSIKIPSSGIERANASVSQKQASRKRGNYLILSPA